MHIYVLSGSSLSFKHIRLNNNDTFRLYNFIKILSSFLVSVLVLGWNWWMILQKLSQTLSDLMMAYKRSESTQDNFGKFIHQFQPKTKTFIRKLERILIKSYRKMVSLLFNQTHSNIYIHIHIYIYIYMCVCVCVCVCV